MGHVRNRLRGGLKAELFRRIPRKNQVSSFLALRFEPSTLIIKISESPP